ncbi:fimbrial-like protein [Providencia sp. PAZ2]|uniref:fimbrial protein n=1 Tax=Providencia lanzhouensis TaxID=3378099 RepID=UPI003D2D73BB
MTLTQKSLYSLLIPTALYAASLGQSAIAATSATTKISASIVGGGCQITAPSTVSIRNGDLIPAEEITTTSDISETFDLTILGCKGYGLTPSITIEGETANASGEDLFVSTSSTSTGYGILLSTDGNSNFNQSDNLATNKEITALVTTEWNKTFASTLDGTIPLKATVSCGTCAANNLQGGELTASLTFNFIYH